MRRGLAIELALWALAGLAFLAGAGFRVGGAGGFEPDARGGGTVRIVTWNVGGAEKGTPHAFRPEHVTAVADALAKLDPDLVLLQEVDDAVVLRRLTEALGSEWRGYRGRGDGALLTRRPNVERWRAPEEVKNSVGARIAREGRDLVVLGLHANAYASAERNATIGAALDALLERDGDGHVLAGDLNLDVDRDKKSELFSDDQHADVETYNYVARELADAALGRGTTAEPDRRLDYVFTSSSLEVVAAGPWKGRRKGTMDHDPVVADLRWR